MSKSPRQSSGVDCGLFLIANMIGIATGIPPPTDLQDKVVEFRMNLARFLINIGIEDSEIEKDSQDEASDRDEPVQLINLTQSYGSYRTDLPGSHLPIGQPPAPEDINLLLPLTPAVFSSDMSSSSPRKDQTQTSHTDLKHAAAANTEKRKWELGDSLSAGTQSKRLKSSMKSTASEVKAHRKTRSTASRVQFRTEVEQASFLNPSQVGSSDSPSRLLTPNTPPRPPGKPKLSSKAAIVTRSGKKER